jgi:hypothetical protein
MLHRSYIRLNSAVSRASREVGGRRVVTALRRCSTAERDACSSGRRRGEPCRGGGERLCRDADGGRFRRLQYGRASRCEGGHRRHSDDQGLYARGVGPDGQRGDLDHVGRAGPHGVLGSPAYWDGD